MADELLAITPTHQWRAVQVAQLRSGAIAQFVVATIVVWIFVGKHYLIDADRASPNSTAGVDSFLAIGVGVTLVVGLLSWFLYQRGANFIRNGDEGTGRLIKRIYSRQGAKIARVIFSYEIDGREYQKEALIAIENVEAFERGQRMAVLYSRRRPRRCIVVQ